MSAPAEKKQPRKRSSASEASATANPVEGTESMTNPKVAPKARAHNPTHKPERFVVGELVGEGTDARREVVLRRGETEYPFVLWGAVGDDEPRVRHPEAAQRLGFKRERDVVELIERIWPENQRPYVRRTVRRTSMPNGGERVTEGKEYWLTEREFLKVCARSETTIADAILDEMIDVFVKVRRGLMRPADFATSDEQLRRAIREEMGREFLTPESRHAEFMRLATVAAESIAANTGAPVDMLRSWAVQFTQGLVGYGGAGRELGYMSPKQFRDARACLKALPKVAEVLPRRKLRKALAQIEAANDNARGQLPINFSFDVGNARVTLTAEHKPAEVPQ